jgi:hypothetical protein
MPLQCRVTPSALIVETARDASKCGLSVAFEPGSFECYKIAASRSVAAHVSAKRQLNSRSPIC